MCVCELEKENDTPISGSKRHTNSYAFYVLAQTQRQYIDIEWNNAIHNRMLIDFVLCCTLVIVPLFLLISLT